MSHLVCEVPALRSMGNIVAIRVPTEPGEWEAARLVLPMGVTIDGAAHTEILGEFDSALSRVRPADPRGGFALPRAGPEERLCFLGRPWQTAVLVHGVAAWDTAGSVRKGSGRHGRRWRSCGRGSTPLEARRCESRCGSFLRVQRREHNPRVDCTIRPRFGKGVKKRTALTRFGAAALFSGQWARSVDRCFRRGRRHVRRTAFGTQLMDFNRANGTRVWGRTLRSKGGAPRRSAFVLVMITAIVESTPQRTRLNSSLETLHFCV